MALLVRLFILPLSDIHFFIIAFSTRIPTVVNPTLHRIEFKILHHIFCEMFKLKKSSFAYDEYVELVFEKFILRLIHTDPVHWLLFFALLVAEWAR